MKIRWKIYIICLVIYISSFLLTTLVVTSTTYDSLLKKEISRSLNEDESTRKSISVYLLTTIRSGSENAALENYSSLIVQLFASENSYIEVYSRDGSLLSSNFQYKYTKTKEEITNIEKTNYVLRYISNNHFLFINSKIDFGGNYIILTTIKDVSYIDALKTNMYLTFLIVSFIGLILMSLILSVLSKLITSPIHSLLKATEEITSGKFDIKCPVISKDEVGMLTDNFNIMAEEIQNKVKELESEAQNKQDFIDNLTHELRTPLTSIIGYSELLLGIKYDEAAFNKSLYFINSEGKRILNLVNSLMTLILSRVNSLKLESCSIKALVESMLEILKLKYEEKAISIFCDGEDFQLQVDADLFSLALVNLLDNAIKYSDNNKKIFISFSCTDKKAIIIIRDEGRGIPKESIAKVLEPFYRVDVSRSRKLGGIGLGLTLVQEIVNAHNGTLNIESSEGIGTSVKVIIPVKGREKSE